VLKTSHHFRGLNDIVTGVRVGKDNSSDPRVGCLPRFDGYEARP
jgi:hypothetical protein